MSEKKSFERYSRQIISSHIGVEGQKKISSTSVLQIGVGGLGSPFSLYLVAAGVKKLTIIDNDVVSISNLQRQIIFNEQDIGKNKAGIAKEKLSRLNSNTEIFAFKEYVTDSSIAKHINDHDFIVDCSDNLETKFLVNRTAIKYNKRCVIAGIKDFFGQILTINPKKSACYQCVFPEPASKYTQDSPLPVIGVTPGILGTLEALEVIKTTLGLPNLENTLLMVNLLDISFNKIKIIKDENCICSRDLS